MRQCRNVLLVSEPKTPAHCSLPRLQQLHLLRPLPPREASPQSMCLSHTGCWRNSNNLPKAVTAPLAHGPSRAPELEAPRSVNGARHVLLYHLLCVLPPLLLRCHLPDCRELRAPLYQPSAVHQGPLLAYPAQLHLLRGVRHEPQHLLRDAHCGLLSSRRGPRRRPLHAPLPAHRVPQHLLRGGLHAQLLAHHVQLHAHHVQPHRLHGALCGLRLVDDQHEPPQTLRFQPYSRPAVSCCPATKASSPHNSVVLALPACNPWPPEIEDWEKSRKTT
mmetsp:Transcript_73731/g.170976  ORF Transcript_73731/g.170976 Transcript_73731/m.170976 type:complete len:275 (+) Transcript_73731:881-1705(+)